MSRAFGDQLRSVRVRAGRSVPELAEALGISRARVYEVERAENIEEALVRRYLAALGYAPVLSVRPLEGQGPLPTEARARRLAERKGQG